MTMLAARSFFSPAWATPDVEIEKRLPHESCR